ncbi:MAG: diacylglycerol/lipid kinase family protein, partial [Bacteroidales bacterium]
MVYHSSTSNNKTCLFVLNPISGNFDKEDLRKWLKDYATKNSLEFWFHETTGSGEEAALLTGSIEKYKPSCLVAVGGDGTVNLVAKVAKEVKIPIGIFPMGSANGLATELDIPFNREEALDVVLHGAIIRIDILNINKREIVLHLCDVGLNARVIKRFEKAVIRGFIGYMGQYFKELFDVKTTRFMLIVNGQKFKTKAIMVVIANASKYGTGAIINPPGKINDGSFEVIFIKPYPFWYIFKLIVVFFTGTL